MRKAGTDLSSRNIKGGVRSRKRGGNPSFTKVPPLNGGETQEAKTSLESKRGKKEGRRGLQRCRVGKKGSKNRPISKGELGNKPERVVPFGIFGGKAALSPLFLAFSWSMAPRKSAWRDRPFAYSSPPPLRIRFIYISSEQPRSPLNNAIHVEINPWEEAPWRIEGCTWTDSSRGSRKITAKIQRRTAVENYFDLEPIPVNSGGIRSVWMDWEQVPRRIQV